MSTIQLPSPETTRQPEPNDNVNEPGTIINNSEAPQHEPMEKKITAGPPPYSIFTPHQKLLIVLVVSLAATFSGFSSNIYFPSLPTIARDLNVSIELVDLTVTTYMIFQGLSPSVWGSFADARGRKLTYLVTFIIYLGACIGLAETKHYYQLVILRCLQSTGSASTIAIGAGVLGDITTRAERGGYMGYFQAGQLAPVAIGPIVGGALAEAMGWKSIFWFLTIAAGVFIVILILVLPETLRSIVGDGSGPTKGIQRSVVIRIPRRPEDRQDSEANNPLSSQRRKTPHFNITAAARILFEKELSFSILFLSVYYAVWQMTITAMSSLFKETYHLSETKIGLTFIGNGVGSIMGSLFTGKLLDYDYIRVKAKYANTDPRDFPLEQARLRTVWIWAGIQCAESLVFGWTLDKGVHISVPIICTFILGFTAMSIQAVTSTFVVDAFPEKGASATAALNMARCLIGAGGTAAVIPIVNGIGVGWTFTLLTGIMLSSFGLISVQMRWGPGWRREREDRKVLAP